MGSDPSCNSLGLSCPQTSGLILTHLGAAASNAESSHDLVEAQHGTLSCANVTQTLQGKTYGQDRQHATCVTPHTSATANIPSKIHQTLTAVPPHHSHGYGSSTSATMKHRIICCEQGIVPAWRHNPGSPRPSGLQQAEALQVA
jgi:hypothetical protein